MVALKNKRQLLSFLSLISLSISCQANKSVVIDNALSECMQIIQGDVSNIKNLRVLPVELKRIKPIGDCGCKSAAFSYSAYLNNKSKLFSYGVVSSVGKTNIVFVLNSDNMIYMQSTYKVDIACSG